VGQGRRRDEEPLPVESRTTDRALVRRAHLLGVREQGALEHGQRRGLPWIEDRVFEVVIPMEDVDEFKGGKKVTVQKKVFPGYLLVRCDLTTTPGAPFRNTPGVHRLRRGGHQADAAVAS